MVGDQSYYLLHNWLETVLKKQKGDGYRGQEVVHTLNSVTA